MPIRPENRHRYPKNWPAISRRIRTERAGGRCECLGECGRGTHTGRCPNRNGRPAYGTGSTVVLTVAHLDHTPENCDETNLRAMCQGCHLHYDRDHHRQTAAATRRAAVEAAGQLALDVPLLPRARCPRGHFLPADSPLCSCQLHTDTRRHGMNPDLYGQRIPPGARIATIQLKGDRL